MLLHEGREAGKKEENNCRPAFMTEEKKEKKTEFKDERKKD
jgi:hypothetical protein